MNPIVRWTCSPATWLLWLGWLAVVCVPCAAWSDDIVLPVTVTASHRSLSNQVAQFTVDLDELAPVLATPSAMHPGAVEVWEKNGNGTDASRKECQFLPATDKQGTVFWLMDGVSAPHSERRFEIRLKAKTETQLAAEGRASRGVTVTQNGDRLVIGNGWYEIVHDRKQGGAIVEISFSKSGHRVPVRMTDAVGDYRLVTDTEPEIAVRAGGPNDKTPSLAVIVECRARFRNAAVPREDCPAVTYRYTYLADSPFVRVDALLEGQALTRVLGNLQQFNFEFPEGKPFEQVNHIVTDGKGELVVSRFKWSPCEFRPPAGVLFENKSDALAIISPVGANHMYGGGNYTIDDKAVHTAARAYLSPWTGQALRSGATLCVATAEVVENYIPLAEPVTVEAAVPGLSERIAACRRGLAKTKRADSLRTATEMLLRAAEQRIATGKRLHEARELIEAAESLPTKKASGGPQAIETKSFVGMANEHTALLFQHNPERVWLAGVFRQQHAFIDPEASERQPFWQAIFRDTVAHGWIPVSSAHSGPVTHALDRPDKRSVRLTLAWPSLPAGPDAIRAAVRITLQTGDPLSRWTIDLEPLSKRLSLTDLTFPIVGGIAKDTRSRETDFLVVPMKTGMRMPNPGAASLWRARAPGEGHWQFQAYWQDRNGLYLGAFDSRAEFKHFKSLPTGDGSVALSIGHGIPGLGVPGNGYKMSFDCVVGTFEGDWFDAGQIYRQWMLRQPWCPKTPLHANKEYPQWQKDLCVSLVRYGQVENLGQWSTHPPVLDIQQMLGSPPMLLIWYQSWFSTDTRHHIHVDEPNVASPPGFADAVAKMQAHNIPVLGYTLLYWWDTASQAWLSGDAMKSAAGREDLSPFKYVIDPTIKYGTRLGYEIANMCPAARPYQEKMKQVIGQLLDAGPVDGTYFDLSGCNIVTECFNPEHGHPVGAGNFAQSAQELIGGVRDEARKRKPKFVMVTESASDFFSTVRDGYMIFQENVPLLQSMLADYQRPLGDKRCIWEPAPLEAIGPAKNFVGGTPIGRIIGHELTTNGQPDPAKVAYYKRLAQHKQVAMPWLNLGRMLRPVEVTGVVPAEPAEFVEGTMVPHATWQAPDGSIALVFANARHSVPVTFRYTFDPAQYRLPSNGSMALYQLTPDGEPPKPRFEKATVIKGPVNREETLPPGGVLILVARPNR